MPKKRHVLWLPAAVFHVAFPELPFSQLSSSLEGGFRGGDRGLQVF